MCDLILGDGALPDGVKCGEEKDLERRLFHVESLQHQRVYFYLVAQTIFFLAAATVSDKEFLLVGLCIGGFLTSVAFTIINLKHHWRVLWITRKLNSVSDEYRRYINFSDFEKLVRCDLGPVDDFVSGYLVSPKSELPHGVSSPLHDSVHIPVCPCIRRPSFLASTGFWFTWGLFIIFSITWAFFLTYALYPIDWRA